MSEQSTQRDKIIIELLYNSYPLMKAADQLCSDYSKMRRKSKCIRNARAMGQILRKFKLVSSTNVIQNADGYNVVCRYQALYKLKEIDFKNLTVYQGKPTPEIMSSLYK